MVLPNYFVATFIVFYAREAWGRTSCSITLNTEYTAQEEPLFLDQNAARIIYPNNKGSIEVSGGDKLRVYCGEGNFKHQKTHSDSFLVQCLSGKSFKLLSQHETQDSSVDETQQEFLSHGRKHPHFPHTRRATETLEPKSFSCRNAVRSAVRPGKPCGLTGRHENHQEFSIGFPIKLGNGFLPLISVCFNRESKSVLWSKHVVSPNVEYHMSKVPRIQFIQDSIPYAGRHLNVERLYSRNQQKQTIANLLHSKTLAEKYIEPKGNGFFARGHLAPKGDFVYAGEQLATFHFINVAPQWQYFNGGQWEKTESTLRNYIINSKVQATVLTLTLGITQLEDEQGNDEDIFLYYNQANEDKLIKVPKLYAKIINFGNSTASNKSVVIVGINQPYENHVKMSTNDIICQDVCHRYPWLSAIVQSNDYHHSSGYIYCCSPAEFISYLKSGQGHMVDSGYGTSGHQVESVEDPEMPEDSAEKVKLAGTESIISRRSDVESTENDGEKVNDSKESDQADNNSKGLDLPAHFPDDIENESSPGKSDVPDDLAADVSAMDVIGDFVKGEDDGTTTLIRQLDDFVGSS